MAKPARSRPDILLPNLLDKGTKQVKFRQYILPILGERGRWLASQNKIWAWASPEIEGWSGLMDKWQAAVPAKRQALLRQLRFMQPDRGRQILEQTWKTNSDVVRNQIIKI